MSTARIGRNDPCPCGSGRKYKQCCLRDEVQREVTQRNEAILDDFAGLSPAQMYGLLYAPFESPGVVEFAPVVACTPEALISVLFERLCQALDAGELKATAKGNLPRAFCREAWESFSELSPFSMDMPIGKVNKEEDFHALHVTRLVAQEAGLLRKYKGRFRLTRKCKTLRDESGGREIYPCLFTAYASRFNWAYSDSYPDLRIIQQGFAFSLYLLSRYGSMARSRHFYADAFLRAFPMMVEEAEPDPWENAEQNARRCYALRTLERFAAFLGLATVSPVRGFNLFDAYEVTATPLLHELVRFHPG